jgi:hypothetical protein
MDPPWVEAEGGDDEVGMAPGQFGDARPVLLGSAVDDAAGHPSGAGVGDEFRKEWRKPWILQVIVRVAALIGHD